MRLLIFGVMALLLVPAGFSFTIDVPISDLVYCSAGGYNVTYGFDFPMVVGTADFYADRFYFNDSVFRVAPSTGDVTVLMTKMDFPNVSFNVTSASHTNTVLFTFGGFDAGERVDVYLDAEYMGTSTVNGTGVLEFYYSGSFSTRVFDIISSDNAPPVVHDVGGGESVDFLIWIIMVLALVLSYVVYNVRRERKRRGIKP